MRITENNEDRIKLVRDIFDKIAPRYDIFNRVASLGRDVYWRKVTASKTRLIKTNRLLDLAAGTCDLTLALAEARPEARVVGTDFVYSMLELGREKTSDSKYSKRINLAAADALNLPFPDSSFDSTTMAFGIRNIPDKLRALKEMHRVLVPGGRTLILELSFPRFSWFTYIYTHYLNRLIPRLGRLISKDPIAYQYLADSIMDFPAPKDFCELMLEAGFSRTGFKKMTLGVAILFWADKDESNSVTT